MQCNALLRVLLVRVLLVRVLLVRVLLVRVLLVRVLLVRMLLVRIRGYLKSVVRQFLILDTHHPDTIFT
jgi:hypothetical protein